MSAWIFEIAKINGLCQKSKPRKMFFRAKLQLPKAM